MASGMCLLLVALALCVAVSMQASDLPVMGSEAEFHMDYVPKNKQKKSKWRMAVKDENLWKDGVIPYLIAPLAFTETEVKELKESMQDFMTETCLVFRQATEADTSRTIIRRGNGGCNAHLGSAYENFTSHVHLGSGCKFYGLFLHELGHTIGLSHEHQHPDRDQGVYINLENVEPSMREWFDTIPRDELEMHDVPYDVQSIMHYGVYAFSRRDGDNNVVGKTIIPRDPYHEKFLYFVYMKDMSWGDVKRINSMYKCAAHCGDMNCGYDAFPNKYCQCVSKREYADRRCYDKESWDYCQKNKADCDSNEEGIMYDIFTKCRKTCGRCYEAI